MKRIKKLAALMMAAIMALAMSITAFAADVTENDSDASKKVEHTYEIYQIFIGDYAKVEGKDVLSNIKWGGNSKHRTGEVVDDAVLKELEAVQNATSDTEKLAVINKYANLDSTPMMTGTETKYTGLTPGYYLVKDKDGIF